VIVEAAFLAAAFFVGLDHDGRHPVSLFTPLRRRRRDDLRYGVLGLTFGGKIGPGAHEKCQQQYGANGRRSDQGASSFARRKAAF